MELSQKVEIPLPVTAVWRALNDPDILKQCLPGCETFTRTGDNSFQMQIKASVGPVKATFNGEVELTDINPPHAYTLVGAGKGGVAGFAKGSAHVQLAAVARDTGEATVMTYMVNAAVGGKLAQIGSRLVSGAAKKMAAEFFTRFVRIICNDTENTMEVHLETLAAGN